MRIARTTSARTLWLSVPESPSSPPRTSPACSCTSPASRFFLSAIAASMVRRHRSPTSPACGACASFGHEDALTSEGIVRCARAEPCPGSSGGGAHFSWCVIPRTQIPQGQWSSPDADERDDGRCTGVHGRDGRDGRCTGRRLTPRREPQVIGGLGTTSRSPAHDSGQALELLELGAADANAQECFDVRVVGALFVTHLCFGTGRESEKRCVIVGVREGNPDSAVVSMASLNDALAAVAGGAAATEAALKARFASDWSVLCGGGRGCHVAVSHCGLAQARPIIAAARSCWLQSQNVSREVQSPLALGSSPVKKNKMLHALQSLTGWASGTRGRRREIVEDAQNRMPTTPPRKARDGVAGLRRAQTSTRATRSLSLESAAHLMTLDRKCKKERSPLSVPRNAWAPPASSNEPMWSYDEEGGPDKFGGCGGGREVLNGPMDMDIRKQAMKAGAGDGAGGRAGAGAGAEDALALSKEERGPLHGANGGSASDGGDNLAREQDPHDHHMAITKTVSHSEGPEDSSMSPLESFPFAVTQSPVDFSSMFEGDASLESSWFPLEA